MTDDFGFSATQTARKDHWRVFLPSDDGVLWIAGGDDPRGATHDEAVEAMEEFIMQAQVALRMLRAGETLDPPP